MRFVPAVAVSLMMLLMTVGIVSAQEDITPPVLFHMSFEPKQVDTSKSAQIITVTVHVADDLSGVEWVAIGFRKPGTTQKIGLDIVPETTWGNLLEGDNLNGRYSNTMILPRYSAFGVWEMYYVALIDNVGNRSDIWKPDTEDAMRESEWPSLFNDFAFVVGSQFIVQQ